MYSTFLRIQERPSRPTCKKQSGLSPQNSYLFSFFHDQKTSPFHLPAGTAQADVPSPNVPSLTFLPSTYAHNLGARRCRSPSDGPCQCEREDCKQSLTCRTCTLRFVSQCRVGFSREWRRRRRILDGRRTDVPRRASSTL